MPQPCNTIIGYDAKRICCNTTGLGSYGRTLVNALAPMLANSSRLLLYSPTPGRDDLRTQVADASCVAFRYPETCFGGVGRSLWRTFGMARSLQRDGVQLFHGLSGELPTGLRQQGIKSIVTVHDLIFMRHPEYYKPIDVAIYKWKFHLACRTADHMVAISQRTKDDIMELGHYPEERISVIYQGCAARFAQPVDDDAKAKTRNRYHLPARYILNVGTVEERKNVALAVRALPQLPPDVGLVVVGRHTPYAQKVAQLAQKLGVAGRVLMLTGVPNDHLPAIYAMAEAFVYPSRYEGFGIPIIEAVQSGLPVVAATGSCLEEAGGPDCFYVGPDDHDAMAAALLRLLGDDGERLARLQRSRDYVRRFENCNVAAQVIELYEQLLGKALR